LGTLKKNFLFNLLLTASKILLPLITFPYATRVLKPSGIGWVSLTESTAGYAIVFAALGIPVYGIREVSKRRTNQQALNNLFSELFVIHLLISISIFICYLLFVFFNEQFALNSNFFYVGSLMILFNVFSVEWFFQGIEQFKFITIRSLLIKFLQIIAIFLLVKSETDGLLYFSITTGAFILNAMVNFYFSKKFVKLNLNVGWSSVLVHVKPLIFIFSSLAFISIFTLMDTILLGILAPSQSVGYYSTALKISKTPLLLITALGTVLIPKLSLLHAEGNKTEFLILIKKSIQLVITFSIPILFFILGVSKELIYAFAGPGYEQAEFVLVVTSFLCLIIGLSNIFGMQIITPMSKDKYLTFSVLVGSVVSLLLNILLIPIFKEKGAAISLLVTELVVTILVFYFSKKLLNFSMQWVYLFKTIFICLPILLFPLLIENVIDSQWIILLISFVFTAIYYCTMQMFVFKNIFLIELLKMFGIKV
jgi:O-antigen/teichoic acid export membrane protein